MCISTAQAWARAGAFLDCALVVVPCTLSDLVICCWQERLQSPSVGSKERGEVDIAPGRLDGKVLQTLGELDNSHCDHRSVDNVDRAG